MNSNLFPAKGNEHLVVGCAILPDSFDPDNFMQVNPWSNPMNWDMQIQLFDTFFQYGTISKSQTLVQDTGHFSSMLANHIESNEDGYTYRISLQEDIRSEYGHELTADDVYWSWQAVKATPGALQPPDTHWLDTGDPGEVGRWIALTGSAPVETNPVSVIDKYTVEFNLREPSLAFPHILTMALPPIYDSTEAKKHATEADPFARKWLMEHSCGFSPYYLHNKTDEELILKAREGYKRINPKIKTIEYLKINPAEYVDSLMDGCIDLFRSPSPKEADAIKQLKGPVVFEASGNQQLSLQMDIKISPYNDLHFRKALMHLIPYDSIIKEIYLGYARPWNGVVSDVNPAYQDFFNGETNFDLAKKELAMSAYSNESLELYYPQESILQKQIVSAIIENAAKINLSIKSRPVSGEKMSAMQKKFQIPFAIAGGGHRCAEMSYAMPHDFGDRIYGITNWIDYNNADLNKMIEDIKFNTDTNERLNLIKKSHTIVANDLPWIFIAQPSYLVAHKPGLQNISWRSRASGPQAYADLYWENS